MGGNAFKEKTRRYSKEEYELLYEEFVNEGVRVLFPNTPVEDIIFYREKESFGDMDILLVSDELPRDWLWQITEKFNIPEYSKNGNVYSLLYKDFQIDIILTQHKYFLSSNTYFAYNDLGNLMGRISHKMGIKYGHKGLSIVVRESQDHILGEIELTNNPNIIFDILGLDIETFRRGFDNKHAIFSYVASSPYFNPDIYLLDNRSHTSRTRDRKRQTYAEFLDWCEEIKDSLNHYPWSDMTEKGGYNLREPYYTDIVLKYWPEVEEKVSKLIYDYNISKQVKQIISSEIIMEITGLSGKDLGTFIAIVRDGIFVNLGYSNEDVIAKIDEKTFRGMVDMIWYVHKDEFK